VSKRSSRRLAVVAGAALAVGSMAPAMATRIDGPDVRAVGTAGVAVNGVDADALMGSVGSSDLALPTNLVFGSLGNIKATLGYFGPLLVSDAYNVLSDGVGCPIYATAGGLDDLGLAAVARVAAHVDLAHVVAVGNAAAVLDGPLGVVGDLKDCLGEVKSDAIDLLGDTKAAVTTVAGVATGTALGVAATATSLPTGVAGTAAPLVLNTLNGLNVEAFAQAAALVSLF
jgi:hypothetical protein